LSRPSIQRHAPRPRPVETKPAATTVLAAAPQDSEVTDPAFSPVPAPAPVVSTAPKPVQKAESPALAEPGTDDLVQRPQGRGRRFLKAVGRFLRITRGSNPEEQSLRQP
jgi:hypothetical protein